MLRDHAAPAAGAKAGNAWLLGITPEIAVAPWLETFNLFAVERSPAMIDAEWPGDTDCRQAICADWLRAPFADESFDLAIGDGCLTHVGFPNGVAGLLSSIYRCLRPDGYLMLRQFRRPNVVEAPDAVISELLSGAIGSIHAFKWRLLMAVQGGAPDVAVDDAWQVWQAAGIEAAALATERGWPLEQIETMEIYRGSSARYNFMRFEDALERIGAAGFDLVEGRTGSYELAERCPCVLFRKRRN